MKEVLFISSGQYNNILSNKISEEGTTMVQKSIVTKLKEKVPGFNYGSPRHRDGCYAEIISSKTYRDRTYYGALTFPTSPEAPSSNHPREFIVIEKPFAEVRSVEEAFETALKSPTLMAKYLGGNWVEKALDLVYPGDWSPMGGRPSSYIIRFPEIVITNSNKKKHTIRDLFVRLDFNSTFTNILGLPSAMRMTLDHNELYSGYRHSHIHVNVNNWSIFCVGDTNITQLIQTFMSSSIVPDKFIGFLYQLNEYVRWESLEGGPYIRIDTIRQQAGTGIRGNNLAADQIRFVAKEIIDRLTLQDVLAKGRPDMLELNLSTKPQMIRLMALAGELCSSSYRLGFNVTKEVYEQPGAQRTITDSTQIVGYREWLNAGQLIFNTEVYQRKLIAPAAEATETDTYIQTATCSSLDLIFRTINSWLSQTNLIR